MDFFGVAVLILLLMCALGLLAVVHRLIRLEVLFRRSLEESRRSQASLEDSILRATAELLNAIRELTADKSRR